MQPVLAVRTSLRWGITHGALKLFNRRQAARGDLFARLMTDPDLRADPWETYERIRAEGDVVGHGRIQVTGSHAVVTELLRSDDFGVAGAGQLPQPARAIVGATSTEFDTGPVEPPSLLALDPPDHTRLRRLVSRSFTPRRVTAMNDRVEARTHAALEQLAAAADAEGRVDLIEHFAALLPVAVIADLLGVPEDDRGELVGWGNEAARLLDGGLSLAEFYRSTVAIRGLHHWVDRHLDRLRAHPGDDLLSGILESVESLPEEEKPTPLELRGVVLLVLGAGFETTVNLIGNAVALLDAHPDQLALCTDDPDRWPGAVEEVLRHDSPVQFTARMARRRTTIAGRPVEPGHMVLLMLGAANRDPDVFSDPARFDVLRPDADQHVSFSLGAHFCIGAQLARLEAAVALRELYRRHPGLRVDGTPRRRSTQVLRGYESLPVRLA